ncbi:MAG: aminotransferase class III-fold pyridoxal phosphate-dependent enzyme, partial [Pseudomonadales bacterium]|nr:aminotransferase class III-fold pyridoxal phosphate-dependent enzyme [Pseudomonadales bacterium]
MSDILQQCISDYQVWSPISASKAQQARRVFPGGDTRMSAHYPPYPLFMERGEGARMIDADGHELIDFMNNFTALIHGHANPQIVEAVQSQIARGSAFAAPTDNQIELGELIRTRVPSVEQLRFTASGTEATLMAIRCARAFTGRNKIMKMEGGYHGSYEMAEVSLVPHPKHSGSLSAPVAVPIDNSHSESMFEDVVVCPYNEPEAARGLIRMHAEDLAAIIIEPVQGSMGMVAATAEFLQLLREESEQAGILLIFDEVITLRNGFGGMQQSLGITPDLTAMGKIIGGGLPVGAIGGREDLLRVFHPDERRPV